MTSRHRSARSFERKYALAPSDLDVRGGGAEVDDVVVDVDVEPHEQLGRARGHVQVLVQLSPRREHAVVLPHGEAIGDTGLEHRAHARGRLRVRREERLRVENLRGRIARHGLVRRRRRDRLPRVRGHPGERAAGFIRRASAVDARVETVAQRRGKQRAVLSHRPRRRRVFKVSRPTRDPVARRRGRAVAHARGGAIQRGVIHRGHVSGGDARERDQIAARHQHRVVATRREFVQRRRRPRVGTVGDRPLFFRDFGLRGGAREGRRLRRADGRAVSRRVEGGDHVHGEAEAGELPPPGAARRPRDGVLRRRRRRPSPWRSKRRRRKTRGGPLDRRRRRRGRAQGALAARRGVEERARGAVVDGRRLRRGRRLGRRRREDDRGERETVARGGVQRGG
mmetsp:Transcript_5623/g.20399  ORF Transcript_5623/g.20399 Transcript_5623/m.20399 type:complete len:396 (-) Transcript_5623:95-1282(-)